MSRKRERRARRKAERHQRAGAIHYDYDPTVDPMEARGYKKEKLVARTPNQKLLMDAIRKNDVTLCHGPPGTGKTHVAIGIAVQMMRSKDIEKIVICRPVVPTGRDIGYLPGAMEDKLGPWLQPLFDELGHYVEQSLLKLWKDTKRLEIVPLSMMRGRTFRDAFVILDEAQNALFEELKMFFTRFGLNSKVVAVGDLKQSDLPQHLTGDFERTIQRLSGIDRLAVVELFRGDIVRHPLTGEIESRMTAALGKIPSESKPLQSA